MKLVCGDGGGSDTGIGSYIYRRMRENEEWRESHLQKPSEYSSPAVHPNVTLSQPRSQWITNKASRPCAHHLSCQVAGSRIESRQPRHPEKLERAA